MSTLDWNMSYEYGSVLFYTGVLVLIAVASGLLLLVLFDVFCPRYATDLRSVISGTPTWMM